MSQVEGREWIIVIDLDSIAAFERLQCTCRMKRTVNVDDRSGDWVRRSNGKEDMYIVIDASLSK